MQWKIHTQVTEQHSLKLGSGPHNIAIHRIIATECVLERKRYHEETNFDNGYDVTDPDHLHSSV